MQIQNCTLENTKMLKFKFFIINAVIPFKTLSGLVNKSCDVAPALPRSHLQNVQHSSLVISLYVPLQSCFLISLAPYLYLFAFTMKTLVPN